MREILFVCCKFDTSFLYEKHVKHKPFLLQVTLLSSSLFLKRVEKEDEIRAAEETNQRERQQLPEAPALERELKQRREEVRQEAPLRARQKHPNEEAKNKRDTFREEKEEKTHQEERSKNVFTALEREEERNLATTMAERAIATCIEILFLTGLGALIAKSLPPPLELDVKKTRKEKKRVVEKAARKQKQRKMEEGKGRKE